MYSFEYIDILQRRVATLYDLVIRQVGNDQLSRRYFPHTSVVRKRIIPPESKAEKLG